MIYRRHLNLQKKRLLFNRNDKFTLAILSALSKRAISHLTLIKPKTLFDWQKRFIKNFWTYKHEKTGRKPLSKSIKDLILEMKQGLIQSNGSWNKFLKAQWDLLFSADFMTIDTIFGKRLYLLLIMQLKTRKIVLWKLTEYPNREFVRQQVIEFTCELPEQVAVLVFISINRLHIWSFCVKFNHGTQSTSLS